MAGLDVERLLDETADQATKRNDSRRESHSSADSGKITFITSPARDGRDSRADRERERERDRDHRRSREYDDRRNRGRDDRERRSSRDRDRRRRDDSRPRTPLKGSNKGDSDEDRANRRDRRGDYYGGSRRYRSRSPLPRGYRDDDRRRPREDDHPRRRSRSPRRDDRRRGGRRTATPEPTEDERDKRTVFVQQLSVRAETRHLRKFFEEHAGPVKEAQVVKDRVSGRSKGVGYVEMRDEASIPAALGLTGQKLTGIPIIVQMAEAEKNRMARPTASAGDGNANANGAPFHRLYVGNIHFSITEEDLKSVFSPFGELEHVQLQKEDQGRSKGYGFVQFKQPASAKEALEKMNGFEIANRQIRVGLGNDKFTPESTANLLRNFNAQAQSQSQPSHDFQGSAFSGSGGRSIRAGGSSGHFDRASGRDDRNGGGVSALDDSDVIGVNFNNFSRESLMRKLARIDDDEPAGGKDVQARPQHRGAAQAQPPPVVAPTKSRNIKVQNMFDIEKEIKTGPNWAKDLIEDVQEECESKYGPVHHIDINQTEQEVWIRFKDMTASEKAVRGLTGRLFGGRTIAASYVVDHIYLTLYPNAA